MLNRSIRGSGLQAQSYQSEDGVDYAQRVVAHYKTAHDVIFRVTFSQEADIPRTWPSPKSGEEGVLLSASGRRMPRHVAEAPHIRTHMDMVRERRTDEELEELLMWRLQLLRAKRGVDSS